MLQVELAQLRYRLPRLRGRGITLSQQGGGIGTRGPGETQLEVDRRRIQRRMTKLEKDLERLGKTRATQRKARRRRGLPTVTLVGYTNAGKSTLLNRITEAEVRVEDRLFSTLDPTTRRLRLPGGETILCSDTVGFVRRLPHELVEAFQSTLEVVTAADLIVHVVDGAASDAPRQIEAVREVLRQIEAGDRPELLVVNKLDRADASQVRELCEGESAIAVSARTGEGVEKLLDAMADRLRELAVVVELVVPYDRGDVLAALHRDGEVLIEVHAEIGTRVRARIDELDLGRYREFVTG
jgi:GTP-binding protein HflX